MNVNDVTFSPQTILAKALYDNTAESPDELAFHKGDVVMVIEQTIKGSVGWWKCSLRGQEGLAPANRLQLLSPAENIYQTPRSSEASPTYEVMEPSTHILHSPVPYPWRCEALEGNHNLNKVSNPPTPTYFLCEVYCRLTRFMKILRFTSKQDEYKPKNFFLIW